MKQKQTDWSSPSLQKSWVEGSRKGRGLRILPKNGAYFVHVTSRTRGQEFLFGNEEKKSFLKRVRQWSEFSGIGVLTHCLMSNHFHLLLFVPEVSSLSHEEILFRLQKVWPDEKVEAWEKVYTSQTREGKTAMDKLMIDRMGDLSSFMRVIKQSFSNWYNHRTGCKGTFWEGRYRSVVVEHNPLALMSVAAYIDLNPVRAGLVKDPQDAMWSGYGSACSGDLLSQWGVEFLVYCSRGHLPNPALNSRRTLLSKSLSSSEVQLQMNTELQSRINVSTWNDAQSAYRIWLYSKGRTSDRGSHLDRIGFSPQQVLAEFEKYGEIPHAQSLRHKRRCYTRGVGIGSPEFLEHLFKLYRHCFGPKRKIAGCKLKDPIPGIKVLRQVD